MVVWERLKYRESSEEILLFFVSSGNRNCISLALYENGFAFFEGFSLPSEWEWIHHSHFPNVGIDGMNPTPMSLQTKTAMVLVYLQFSIISWSSIILCILCIIYLFGKTLFINGICFFFLCRNCCVLLGSSQDQLSWCGIMVILWQFKAGCRAVYGSHIFDWTKML
jgi:hypothetical protein